MSLQSWNEFLSVAPGDGTAVANTVTATSLLTSAANGAVGARFTLPAQFFDRPGKALKVVAAGRVSNIVTTPGTLTLDVRLGGVIACNGGAMALNVVAKTNVPWKLEWLLTCRNTGSGTGANLMHQGEWSSESVVGSPLPAAGGCGTHLLPNAAPAVGTGFDSTAALTVDLFATWSIANAGNSIQLHQFFLQSLN